MTWARMSRPVTGRMVLWAFIVFFAVVALVNGTFILLSVKSFPGVETEDAYRKGLAYDSVIADDAARRERGWTVAITWRSSGPARGRLVVAVRAKDGAPLAGLAARALLRRPTHGGQDRTVRLSETAAGSYGADIALPGSGNWEVVLHLGLPGLAENQLRERLVVP
ncbi:MAG: hypothetical protein RL477_626 [Pseudomonadota bacterium]|jgi:nitrogen fixation protein FixH